MISKQVNAYHKAVMIRILSHIFFSKTLKENLAFKGGSCASFLGWLDRFSVDLDFDLLNRKRKKIVEKELNKIFSELNLEVKGKARKTLFYFLRYESPVGFRKNLKVSVYEDIPKANKYQLFFIDEIKKFVYCQTKETMFANKLVAVIDRYKKHQAIAGRDIYDIIFFFSQNFSIEEKIIKERTGEKTKDYISKLINFIEKEITQKIIDQDLNYLLSPKKFKSLRKTLKIEVLFFLKNLK